MTDVTRLTCYASENIFDARRIHAEYFLPNIERFMGKESGLWHAKNTIALKKKITATEFRSDMAIAFMFARFIKHSDLYYDLKSALLGNYTEATAVVDAFPGKSQRFNPRLVYAHGGQVTVLVVRGTDSFSDLATDLTFFGRQPDLSLLKPESLGYKVDLEKACQDLQQWVTHPGILQHALNAFILVLNDRLVTTQIQKDSKNGVMVYGHSLGASCGVILAYLLADVLKCSNVQCTVIACPPVFRNGGSKKHDIKYTHYYPYRDFAAKPITLLSRVMPSFYGPKEKNISIMPGVGFRKLDIVRKRDEHSLLTVVQARDEARSSMTGRDAYAMSPGRADAPLKVVSDLMPVKYAHLAVLIKMPIADLHKKYEGMVRECPPDKKPGSIRRKSIRSASHRPNPTLRLSDTRV